ncbi:hypothetical protein LINPERPRIM_LOCUS19226 [Linum perenne]
MSDHNQSSPAKKKLPSPLPKDGDENFIVVKKSTTKTKHFMSPTISGASKVNQPSRAKILAERNGSPVTLPRSSSFKLSSGNDGFGDENEKECNNSNNNKRVIIEDSSPIPYDPASNYLSPRPRFLRYRPDRRSQILERRVEFDALDLKKDAGTQADISSGDSTPLAPAKDDEVDSVSDVSEEEFDEDEFEDDGGSSIFRRVFQVLMLLMVLVASTLYIMSMNNHLIDFDEPTTAADREIQSYPIGFLRRIEANGSYYDYLLAGGGTLPQQQELKLVNPVQEVVEEEEAMEVLEGGILVVEQPSEEAMEMQEQEVSEDGIDGAEKEVSYTEILHPAAMEVQEEERFIDVEQKGDGEEAMEMQEEEVSEDWIDGAEEEVSYTEIIHPAAMEVQEEERFIDVEQKGDGKEEEEEEAMEVSEEEQPSEATKIQEEEDNVIDVEEVSEDVPYTEITHLSATEEVQEQEKLINGEEEITTLHEEESDSITTKNGENSKVDFDGGRFSSLGAIFAATLVSTIASLLVLLSMRRTRNAAASQNRDDHHHQSQPHSESVQTPQPMPERRKSSNSSAIDEKKKVVVISSEIQASGRDPDVVQQGKKGASSIAEATPPPLRSAVVEQGKRCATMASGKKGTSSCTTTPLRRSTRIAAASRGNGILSP